MPSNLILPVAGKSSRFQNMRPKWMLTHPSGNFMLIESILGLNSNFFDYIYVVYLSKHEKEYSFLNGLKEEFKSIGILNKIIFVALDNETKDQAETVYTAIKLANICGSIFIKDSDNYFVFDLESINSVCYYDLNQSNLNNIINKSYITFDENQCINNIVEKNVISSYISVGGYFFENAKDFVKYYEKNKSTYEIYISHIIYDMLLNGIKFKAKNVINYQDWGTIRDWNDFKKKYATIFIDIDGVLVENSSSHFPPYIGNTKPIEDNVNLIKELYNSGCIEVVITTSRKEKYRNITELQLKNLGIKYKALIMNLYHAKRIIINDYDNSNQYKSCDAINIKRNSNELISMLNSFK